MKNKTLQKKFLTFLFVGALAVVMGLPISAKASSGTVKISGSGFDAAATNVVDFYDYDTGNLALEVKASSTSGGKLITVSFTNLAAGTYVIDVTTKAGVISEQPDLFVFPAPPTITSMSPVIGAQGTSMTFIGSGFGSSNTVSFTNIDTGVVSTSSVSTNNTKNITFALPNLPAGDYVVSITPLDGSPATAPNILVVDLVPTISSISPNPGIVGTYMTIKGSNFDYINNIAFVDPSTGSIIANLFAYADANGATLKFLTPNIPAGSYNVSVTDLSSFSSAPSSITVIVGAVNGICGSANGVAVTSTPTANLCSVGTASAISGKGPWSWTCAGSNGGSTISCSAQLLVISGVCGSANGVAVTTAPTANLCSVGKASAVSGSGPWNWSCAASSGTSKTDCSAQKKIIPINGVCGSQSGAGSVLFPNSNLCSVGTASTVQNGSGITHWIWTCSGTNGGADASCYATAQSQNGTCGSTKVSASMPTTNLCATGYASSVTFTNLKFWLWNCFGYNGGGQATCSATTK